MVGNAWFRICIDLVFREQIGFFQVYCPRQIHHKNTVPNIHKLLLKSKCKMMN